MGIDWEEILGAEGEDLADAWQESVNEAEYEEDEEDEWFDPMGDVDELLLIEEEEEEEIAPEPPAPPEPPVQKPLQQPIQQPDTSVPFDPQDELPIE